MVNVSEQITGLAELGTDIGNFIINIIPGVITIVVVLGIVGGVLFIFRSVATLIANAMKK